MSGRCCVVTRVGGCHLMRNRRRTDRRRRVGWSGSVGLGRQLNIYNNMKIQKYKNKIREYSNNIQQQITTLLSPLYAGHTLLAGILYKTTNEGTLAENALRHGPRQEVDIYYNIRIQECKNNIREYTQYQCHRSHMGRGPQLFKMGT